MKTRIVPVFGAFAAVAIATANPSGQSLRGLKDSAIQHVTVATSTAPASASGKIVLHLDVTPKTNIHVYAPGAKAFTPASLVLRARPGTTAGAAVYPAAHPAAAGEDDTPAYRKPFRIAQPVTVAATTGNVVIEGVFTYQACDDRLCYPVASLPVSWTLTHDSAQRR